MSVTRAAAAVLLVLVTGCTVGEPRPTTTTTPVRTVVAGDVPVIDPGGLGGVRLGMTLEDLRATGEIGDQVDLPQGNCPVYALKRANGWVGVEGGVAVDLRLEGGARTVEGLRFGDSRERMEQLYPDLETNPHGWLLPVDDRSLLYFAFENNGDTLTVIGVRHPEHVCLL